MFECLTWWYVKKQLGFKRLIYGDLTVEIQHMWNVKTKVTPVLIGAAGNISKSIRKYLNILRGSIG
jgi:hypothetical protein